MRRDHPPFVTHRFDAIGAGVCACACVRGGGPRPFGVRDRAWSRPSRRDFFLEFFFRARGRFGTSVLDLGSGPPRFGTSSVRAVGFEYNTRFGLLRVEESRASTRASARLGSARPPARPARRESDTAAAA